MKRKTSSTIVLVMLLTLALAAGGCFKPQNRENPDQPPVSPNPKTQSLQAPLYFADDQAMFLVPEIREIKYEKNLPLALVEELIRGPQSEGLYPTLPSSTRVLSLEVYQGVAYVNLSSDFERDYPGGSTGEGMALGSIIQTLTEQEEINVVQFLIEGKKVEVLAKGHMDLSQPLGRSIWLGAVEMHPEEMADRQLRVDNGKDQWFLEPLKTAKEDGPLYRLYVRGQYELIERIERGEYSGTGEALVRHSYKGEKYDIKLIQPEKQGEGGIWAINSIMPYGTEKEAILAVVEKKILLPSQGGRVFGSYDVLGEQELDGHKVVYLWALCEEYAQEGNQVNKKNGVSIPLAVYLFAQDENHNGVLDYRRPQDGKYYESSIRQLFPQDIQEKIAARQDNVEDLAEQNRQRAVEYFK